MYYTTIYVYFIFLIMLLAHVILHKIRVEYVCISLLHNIIAWKARKFPVSFIKITNKYIEHLASTEKHYPSAG